MREKFIALEYFSFIFFTYSLQRYDSGGSTVISSGEDIKSDKNCNANNTIATTVIISLAIFSLFINFTCLPFKRKYVPLYYCT